MLKIPHTLPLPLPPTLFVPTPSRIHRAELCTQRQSQALLSLLSTQSSLQGNGGFIFGKNLRASSIFIRSAIALPEEDYTVYL